VVAVGPGRRAANGDLIEPGVKEGDHVLMPDYGGQEVDLDGTKCAAHSARTLRNLLSTCQRSFATAHPKADTSKLEYAWT